MFERITYISNNGCTIKLSDNANITTDLMNMHLIFEDSAKKVLGEVIDVDGKEVKANFLGEISGDTLIGGNIRKPALDSRIRIIDMSEVPLIMGTDTEGYMELGKSPLYDGVPVYLNVNNFFSNHFAIFGNTGSGKSCGVSRLFQNMFSDRRLNPYKANLFILDSSGEYYNAFNNLNMINNSFNYRFISTNEVEGIGEKLRLPVYLLNKDDLALLLQCTTHSQLPIIERMLKLALVFSQNDVDAQAYKNHLIAKAIMSILYTNETSPNKRNEIFSILASCSTEQFNLEAPVQGIGYVRKFRECFLIDNSGNFSESVLLTEYVNSFIKEEYDSYEPHTGVYYNLDTLEKALNFTLISEGWLRNEQTYGDSVTLRVRLHALIVGDNAKYFDVEDYVSLETYLSSLLIEDGRKYQIVNINLSDIDDDFAKVLTKIYSRLIFDFAKGLKNRGSIPFHIILEEAHRYIQADHDRFLFGYNVFERIAKEGRKYGVILGIITQRPVELSDNVISQCTNFLIFKINHPVDIKYIREMVPHITDEIIEKQKSLQPGTCLGFGLGFKIPLIVKMEMPNPSPLSGNCDVVNIWCGKGSTTSGMISSNNMANSPVFNDNVLNAANNSISVSIPESGNENNNTNNNNYSNNTSTFFNSGLNLNSQPVLESNSENNSNDNTNNSNNTGGFFNSGLVLNSQPVPDSSSAVPSSVPRTENNTSNTMENTPASDNSNAENMNNNGAPSLINIIDAPNANIPMPSVDNNNDNKGFDMNNTTDNNSGSSNNLANKIMNSETEPDDSANPQNNGSGNLNPALSFVQPTDFGPSGVVPEISDVKIDSNGMTKIDSSAADLTLDDIDDNNDFDD